MIKLCMLICFPGARRCAQHLIGSCQIHPVNVGSGIYFRGLLVVTNRLLKVVTFHVPLLKQPQSMPVLCVTRLQVCSPKPVLRSRRIRPVSCQPAFGCLNLKPPAASSNTEKNSNRFLAPARESFQVQMYMKPVSGPCSLSPIRDVKATI